MAGKRPREPDADFTPKGLTVPVRTKARPIVFSGKLHSLVYPLTPSACSKDFDFAWTKDALL